MHKIFILVTFIFCVFTLQAQKIETLTTNKNELYPSCEVISKYHNDWTRIHYKKRIDTFKDDPLNFHEIVFIGNSITEKGGNWSDKFGVEHIRNRGISGDVTDGVLKRLDEITHFQPKAVFILIGINDLFNLHHKEDERSSLKYFKIVPSAKYVAKNILKITKKIHQKSPDTKIYVRTILPTKREFLKYDILEVNNLLLNYEKKGYFTLTDLYSHFANDKDMMRPEFTNDGVHLSETGYEKWMSLEKNIISTIIKE
ncbi:MAG: GDSL-type esterase/lipase family protein [Prolixibacteraceae bacterium]|jgi:lysophospholipase L1-like esterase|nr:GDSL-type esterase/lipase family protein [Prolixibacteraceae bacterium]